MPQPLAFRPSQKKQLGEEDHFALLQGATSAATTRGVEAPTLRLETATRADLRWAASERHVQVKHQILRLAA